MKNIKQIIAILLTCAFMASCGPKVTTTKKASMTDYESFAYLPNTSLEVADNMKPIDETVAVSVISALNDEMVEEGFVLNRENPDLLVLLNTSYDIERMKELRPKYSTMTGTYNYPTSPYYDTVAYNYYKSYPVNDMYNIDYDTVKEGVLIVELFDRKSKKLVWRGTAEDFLSDIETKEEVLVMVDSIFDAFPQ
jgi:hypothetical protein